MGTSTNDPAAQDASLAVTRRRGRLLLVLVLIAAATFGCDRFTKIIAQAELAPGPNGSMLNGIVLLQYEENRGAMMSLGSNLSEPARFWMLTVGVGVLLAGLAAFVIVRSTNSWEIVAGGLAVGGGAGNLLDRLLYDGAVIDFVSVGIGSIRTGVFNVADVAVFLGVGLYMVFALRSCRRPARASGG